MIRYRTIVADPPWPIADPRSRPRIGAGVRRRRSTTLSYDLMSLEDIWHLPVADLAEADAHLFLWVPAGFNREGAGVETARAWGFEPIGELIWEKPNFGLGAFPRPCHEILLVCRRGALPFTGGLAVRSVQRWRQTYDGAKGKQHSAKPEAAMDLIEQVSPGPYLELFSRRHRLGWDVWGNQIGSTVALEAIT